MKQNKIEVDIKNINSSLLDISLNKKIHSSNELIKGNIWLKPRELFSFYDIIIRLEKIEQWSLDINSDKKTDSCKIKQIISQKPLNLSTFLGANEANLITLEPSNYNLDFTLELDKNLSSTFELPENKIAASIRYTISAEILAIKAYPVCYTDIIINSKEIAPTEFLYQSSCINVHSLMFDQGTTILSVNYPKNNYKYLDMIPLTICIDNTRGKLTTEYVKIEILRKVQFFDLLDQKKHEFEKVIVGQKFPFMCLNGQKWNQLISIQMIDLSDEALAFNNTFRMYPELSNKRQLATTAKTNYINCQYILKATCYFVSYTSYQYRPRVKLPLVITHQLIDDMLLLEKEEDNLKKAIMNSQLELDKINHHKKHGLINNNYYDDDEEKEVLEQIKQIEEMERKEELERNKLKQLNHIADDNHHQNWIKDDNDNNNKFIKNDVPVIYEQSSERYHDELYDHSNDNRHNQDIQMKMLHESKEGVYNNKHLNMIMIKQKEDKDKETFIHNSHILKQNFSIGDFKDSQLPKSNNEGNNNTNVFIDINQL